MSEAVADATEAPVAKKRSKLPFILAAVVVLAGGAGGAWYFMSKGKGEAAAHEGKPEAAALAPSIYVSFEPPFVVNFDAGGRTRFLQVAIQVMTRDPHVAEELKRHDPLIRNDLLLLLSNQQYETLTSREGKEKLQHDALEAVRHIVKENAGEPETVESVLFTSFVMQ